MTDDTREIQSIEFPDRDATERVQRDIRDYLQSLLAATLLQSARLDQLIEAVTALERGLFKRLDTERRL